MSRQGKEGEHDNGKPANHGVLPGHASCSNNGGWELGSRACWQPGAWQGWAALSLHLASCLVLLLLIAAARQEAICRQAGRQTRVLVCFSQAQPLPATPMPPTHAGQPLQQPKSYQEQQTASTTSL
jgi:hypothetical protein